MLSPFATGRKFVRSRREKNRHSGVKEVHPMSERRTVIICGVARSGTTALARLLNAHPLVCIGLERYKFPWYRGKAFEPNLFEKDRFFDFQSDDTNILPGADASYAQLYSAMRKKWDLAQVLGDKIPHAFLRMDEFDAIYQGAQYLYIFRSVDEVASSWKARSLNELDRGWRRTDGCKQAVKAWNKGNKRILQRLGQYAGRIRVLSYDRIFCGERSELERLRAFLRLPSDSNLDEAFVESAREHQAVAMKRIQLIDEEERRFIRQNAVMENYWSLMAHSEASSI